MTAITQGRREMHPTLQSTHLPTRASNSGNRSSHKHLKKPPKHAHSLPHNSSHPMTIFIPGSSSSQVQRRGLQTLLGIHLHGTHSTRTSQGSSVPFKPTKRTTEPLAGEIGGEGTPSLPQRALSPLPTRLCRLSRSRDPSGADGTRNTYGFAFQPPSQSRFSAGRRRGEGGDGFFLKKKKKFPWEF